MRPVVDDEADDGHPFGNVTIIMIIKHPPHQSQYLKRWIWLNKGWSLQMFETLTTPVKLDSILPSHKPISVVLGNVYWFKHMQCVCTHTGLLYQPLRQHKLLDLFIRWVWFILVWSRGIRIIVYFTDGEGFHCCEVAWLLNWSQIHLTYLL